MNNLFKKILLGFACGLAISASLLAPAQAALISGDKAKEFNENVNQVAGSSDYSTTVNLESMITTIIRLALSLVGTIFLVLIFFAGNNWMMAAGNEEKIKKSKETIRNLAIGVCLIIAAYAFSSGMGGLLANILLSTPEAAPIYFDQPTPNNGPLPENPSA